MTPQRGAARPDGASPPPRRDHSTRVTIGSPARLQQSPDEGCRVPTRLHATRGGHGRTAPVSPRPSDERVSPTQDHQPGAEPGESITPDPNPKTKPLTFGPVGWSLRRQGRHLQDRPRQDRVRGSSPTGLAPGQRLAAQVRHRLPPVLTDFRRCIESLPQVRQRHHHRALGPGKGSKGSSPTSRITATAASGLVRCDCAQHCRHPWPALRSSRRTRTSDPQAWQRDCHRSPTRPG